MRGTLRVLDPFGRNSRPPGLHVGDLDGRRRLVATPPVQLLRLEAGGKRAGEGED